MALASGVWPARCLGSTFAPAPRSTLTTSSLPASTARLARAAGMGPLSVLGARDHQPEATRRVATSSASTRRPARWLVPGANSSTWISSGHDFARDQGTVATFEGPRRSVFERRARDQQ
jgi:hypothetical protein